MRKPGFVYPDDIKRMAQTVITGLLREEGWELPGTDDEEVTTIWLQDELLDAVNKLIAARQWQPIETAPTDGTRILAYAAAYDDLPAFQTIAAYHPDGGWCVDELREVTHWKPLGEGPQ